MPGLTKILDDFTRANQGPPPSTSWTNGISDITAGEGLVVLSNQCTRKSTGNFRQGSYWNVATYGSDCEIYCTLAAVGAANNDEIDLHLRLTNLGAATPNCYWAIISLFGGVFSWDINRYDAGVNTQLTTTVSQTVAANDKVRFRARGSLLELYRQASGSQVWTLIQSVTDATYGTAGNIGVEIAGSQAFKLDDFGGGTLVADPIERIASGNPVSRSAFFCLGEKWARKGRLWLPSADRPFAFA